MHLTKRARQKAAAGNQQETGRRIMATEDIDFSGILDVAALRAECEGLVTDLVPARTNFAERCLRP